MEFDGDVSVIFKLIFTVFPIPSIQILLNLLYFVWCFVFSSQITPL